MAEHIREILVQEQEHLIDLATGLGENPPDIRGWASLEVAFGVWGAAEAPSCVA